MNRLFILLLMFLLPIGALRAQTALDSIQKGVDIDPKVKLVLEKQVQVNQDGKEKGYRVQIYFGVDKAKASEMKSKFIARYGDHFHAYEKYDAPNFKIRVGDFRTRLEAYAFLKEIKNEFPSAFIVESEIEPDLD